MEIRPQITVSVVSHMQAGLVHSLLRDLEAHCRDESLEVLLTLNVPEQLTFDPLQFAFPVRVLRNTHHKGFSANHNAAFSLAKGRYFCVLNPDVRLMANPFPPLVAHLSESCTGVVGVVAPRVVDPQGNIEDSARRVPTPLKVLKKMFVRKRLQEYVIRSHPVEPEWVAGMFMLFASCVFKEMRGFDERYFLYYEDVDMCCRLRMAGYNVVLEPGATIIHDARRDSHRRFVYLKRHLASMLRFFSSPVFFRSLFLGGRH